MKILADECIHSDLIKALKSAGHDIISTGEVGLSSKGDEVIFQNAVKLKRVLLTFDRGFGDIFRFNLSSSSGVIILLISQMTKEEMIGILLSFIVSQRKKNISGKLVIIGKRKIRISER